MNQQPPAPVDCGKTIEELSDYLATDRAPYDPEIETSPECLNMLDALTRVAQLSRDLIAQDAVDLPAPPAGWMRSIMTNIRNEVRAGRSLPIHHDDPRVQITVTEGAVRALIRAVGDDIDSLLIGKCEIVGDAEQLGAPIEVNITASIGRGGSIPTATSLLRAAVFDTLTRHTQLNVTAVNVSVDDIHQ